MNSVQLYGERPALWIDRAGKKLCWTWNQYYQNAMKFAKACCKIGAKERSAVAIMGVNSPEWVISYIGSIFNNQVNTGIYITNQADACLYQATHAEATVIVVETANHLSCFTANLEKYSAVKAFVVWGETTLPEGIATSDPRFFLWKDFLEIGV